MCWEAPAQLKPSFIAEQGPRQGASTPLERSLDSMTSHIQMMNAASMGKAHSSQRWYDRFPTSPSRGQGAYHMHLMSELGRGAQFPARHPDIEAELEQMRYSGLGNFGGASSSSPRRYPRPSSAPQRPRPSREEVEAHLFMLSQEEQRARAHQRYADSCRQEGDHLRILLDRAGGHEEFPCHDGVYRSWLREMEQKEYERERRELLIHRRLQEDHVFCVGLGVGRSQWQSPHW